MTEAVPSNPTGQDFTSDVELPKPTRGLTATELHEAEPLPVENRENVSALVDGGDAGAGSLDGGNADEGQQEQEQAVVVSEDSETAGDEQQS